MMAVVIFAFYAVLAVFTRQRQELRQNIQDS
jgi:hypothetical protein